MSRRILHMDMDAFFAAVEQRRRPELIGKPVVVGGMGDPSSRGVVATASYEARVFGIHSAMPLKIAYKLNPQAVFLPADFETYEEESRKVKKVLRNISPLMEDVGIDEAFLDISAISRSSLEIGKEIKENVMAVTGLTCSIGIGPNKLLAKIASDMKKPDGYTVIEEDDIEDILWPLPVRKLLGVGPKTETVLKDMGVEIIGDLAKVTPEILSLRFGPSHGNFLYRAACGLDERPIVTFWEPKSISRERTFPRDIGHWQTIATVLAALTKEVVLELRQEKMIVKTITIKVRFSDFQTVTRSKSLEEASDVETDIRRAVFACLQRVELVKKVRLLGVRLSRFEKHFSL
ncbi:MAG: DNA polymerase IV [Syntrophobacterales bacterium]|jgi:DNA polymerase-4|nr:DNA polymerase IV [Syntrophobacterales bacterium]